MSEFAINWLKGANYAEVSVPSGSALKSKLLRLAETRPDEVNNVTINKDGSMVCHVPVNYIKVTPPRQVSEEQREAMSKRSRERWENERRKSDGED